MRQSNVKNNGHVRVIERRRVNIVSLSVNKAGAADDIHHQCSGASEEYSAKHVQETDHKVNLI